MRWLLLPALCCFVGLGRPLHPGAARMPRPLAHAVQVAPDAPVGLAACDRVVDEVEACLPRLPAPARVQIANALDAHRRTWQLAVASGAPAGLGEACHSWEDAISQSMKPIGCKFSPR